MYRKNTKMKKRFILSDDSENSYGYHVVSEGIDLTRFKANPVMFYNHDRWNMPIGKWENISIEDGKLQADAVFDKKDELGATVAQKVADGFLNATSIGFKALAVELRNEGLSEGDKPKKKMYVTSAELLEVSIVDIPANKNAVRLDLSGIDSEEVLHFLAHSTEDFTINNNRQINLTEVNLEEKEVKEIKGFLDYFKNLFSPKAQELTTPNIPPPPVVDNSEQLQELMNKVTTLSTDFSNLKVENQALQAKNAELENKVNEFGSQPGAFPTNPVATADVPATNASEEELYKDKPWEDPEMEFNKRVDNNRLLNTASATALNIRGTK